ncbi:dienelactone hydrolase family protein [Undibacterium sp. Di24W]|uniref:dienelactone hydrolase family protein n=1 Tax=Undibacterium sp. Di24W TaxID=3413033 RepID=UPI003BF09B54
MNIILRHTLFLIAASASIISSASFAATTLQEHRIKIDGQQRRYYHLSNPAATQTGTPIFLINGSGCDDFATRLSRFFERYGDDVNVYYLEKVGVQKSSSGDKCSTQFNAADLFEKRRVDHVKFLEVEPTLRKMPARSIAVLGFSEGGAFAPYLARDSKKIGWLATAGSGGLPQSEEFLIFAARGVAPYANPFSRDYFLHMYEEIKRDSKNLKKDFFGHTYAYWSARLFTDPLKVYASLDIPMVAAMGEKDESVPIESGHALRDYFRQYPQKKFQFVEFPGASHGLSTPDNNGAQLFIAQLAAWFKDEKIVFQTK